MSTYSGHENGGRGYPNTAAKRYGAAFGVPWVWLKDGGRLDQGAQVGARSITTRGEVAAGRWLDIDADVDASDFDQFPVAPDPAYPIDSQFGLIVRGTSMNKVVAPGDMLHCVDVRITGAVPFDDDIVIVERRRLQQGLREITAKRVRKRGNMAILAPDSTDPRWQPIELDADDHDEREEIEVIALVIGRYQSLRKRK